MKILIVQNAKLGDMVCTTPMFRAIKKAHPQSFLAVCGNSLNKELLVGNPNVDKYVVVKDLYEYIQLNKPDVAILTSPDPTLLWKLLKRRVKKIIVPKIVNGFSPYYTKKYRLLSLFATRVSHRMGYYAPQEYLNMLEVLNIRTTDTRKELYVNENIEKKIKKMLDSYPGEKIAISPNAGNKIKEWPVKNFYKITEHIISTTNFSVVIVGGSDEIKKGEEMKKRLAENRILDTTGRLTIEELKALIKNVKLYISVDTGPIYIAEAFEVPTVDIIGPINENEQPPVSEKHLLVLPPNRKKPELYVMNAKVYNLENAQKMSRSTRVEDVIAAMEQIYRQNK